MSSKVLGTTAMSTPFFHEFKKQASFFLREKLKTARLALTDVTPAELLVEEATAGNTRAPDAKTMGFISRAAFEIDDYWRIVEVLHKRLSKFDKKKWREPYHAVLVLEHLLTHGPESVADEFQNDRDVIQELGTFQYIDERGFNWGLTVRKKSERVLKLLEKGPLLKEERERGRKVARGIQGFGSFDHKWSSAESVGVEQHYGRSNSHYEDSNGAKDLNPDSKENYYDSNIELDAIGKKSIQEAVVVAVPDESKPLLPCGNDEPKIDLHIEKSGHPFDSLERKRNESLLLLSQT